MRVKPRFLAQALKLGRAWQVAWHDTTYILPTTRKMLKHAHVRYLPLLSTQVVQVASYLFRYCMPYTLSYLGLTDCGKRHSSTSHLDIAQVLFLELVFFNY